MEKSPGELEGYILDMLDEMEKDPGLANIQFSVTPVADGKYGTLDDGGHWDGMIKELFDRVRRPVWHDLLSIL